MRASALARRAWRFTGKPVAPLERTGTTAAFLWTGWRSDRHVRPWWRRWFRLLLGRRLSIRIAWSRRLVGFLCTLRARPRLPRERWLLPERWPLPERRPLAERLWLAARRGFAERGGFAERRWLGVSAWLGEIRPLRPRRFARGIFPLPALLAQRGIPLLLGVDELLPRIAMLAAGPPVARAWLGG